MPDTGAQTRATQSGATQAQAAQRQGLRQRTAAAGLVLGAVFGLTFAIASSRAVAERQISSSKVVLDATHLPPLLTAAGEDVVLRYDVNCASAVEESDAAACATTGTVFVRSGMSGLFRAIPLTLDRSASEGRYVAHVPTSIARSLRGFSYYAVLVAGAGDDGNAGVASVTLPAGGAEAPHRSLPLGRAVDVALGRHDFGRFRRADARVLQTSWGNGIAEIGLEGGVNVAPVGGSSFDVDAGGVLVLDHVRRRVLRWTANAMAPSAIPVSIDGTIADLAVAGDGTMYVLDGARAGRGPALRTFDRSGRALSVTELGERTATQVKVGPAGALVLQHPSGQWLPAARDHSPLSAQAQAQAGRSGRLLPDGHEVVVLRVGNEIRVALVDNHVVSRSWRITSASPLAEVQLAEPMGDGLLVVVVRVYSDTDDDFVALILGRRGLLARESLESADWAETAPLSRFRLVGASLYQLGSTRAGLFVDRFDLEVTR